MAHDAILELLRREPTTESHAAIRALWKKHSIAEDSRDIPGLLSTLTQDCVYELVQTGHRWVGHAGAETFYRSLLGAFPDIKFQLVDIVIGPQGVCEDAEAEGTQLGEWLGAPPTGKVVRFRTAIFFPWDPVQRLFRGERIYTSLSHQPSAPI